MWYHNAFPNRRGTLFEVNNNPENAIDGARRKAMGMVAGVADLCLIKPGGGVLFVEVKRPEGIQSPAQKNWQEVVEWFGAGYVIVRSLEEFQQVVADLP